MRFLILLLAIVATPAAAQMSVPVDRTGLATAAQVSTLMQSIPRPADVVPLAETMSPTIGTDPTKYALEGHTHARITDSPKTTTTALGTFSGTFRAGLFTRPPTIALTWVTPTGISATSCEIRTLTTTTYTGRCYTLLGLVVSGPGIEINVVALPDTSP